MTSAPFRVLASLALAALTVVTLAPISLRPRIPGPVALEHVAALFVLVSLFALAYSDKIALAVCLVVFCVFPLEIMQFLQPDRHARLMDAVTKLFGSCFGLLAGWFMARLFRIDGMHKS